MDGDATEPDGEDVRTDVCVVGAPAGITLARELGARGVHVCVLESGGLEIEPDVQAQSRGESDGYPIHRLDRSRVRGFGGTLLHPHLAAGGWAARPLDPIDFEVREGLRDVGWPFPREHLDSYYTRAEEACGIATFDEAAKLWIAKTSKLGQSLVESELEPAVFQFRTPDHLQMWNLLCASPNVRVFLHTRAVEVVTDSSGGHIERIVGVRGSRERVVIRPLQVVFAAGGIENARLLLTANHGRGLGNEHNLVGRYFAERIVLHAGHVVLSDVVSIQELGSFHRSASEEIGGGLRIPDTVQRDLGLLNCCLLPGAATQGRDERCRAIAVDPGQGSEPSAGDRCTRSPPAKRAGQPSRTCRHRAGQDHVAASRAGPPRPRRAGPQPRVSRAAGVSSRRPRNAGSARDVAQHRR